MSLSYVHTLIPDQVEYAPRAIQVADFFAGLAELGAVPTKARLVIVTSRAARLASTKKIAHREGRNPLTGETVVIPGLHLKAVLAIRSELVGLREYEVRMFGEGPSKLPLFPFHAKFNPRGQPYEFEVGCCLRPKVVSTSDYHRDGVIIPEAEKVARFGDACSASDRLGFFINHATGETIRVPNAGCARFWIEFGFGKWLFPEMKVNSLDLLPACVIDAAKKAFAMQFAQGCHWG